MDIELTEVEKKKALALAVMSSPKLNRPGPKKRIAKWTASAALTDLVGLAVTKTYPIQLKKTEEVALDFLCSQTYHPVVSCFRELTSSDLRNVIGNNKLKKRLPGNLEQSFLYLGLIDYMAMSIDNALYTEKQKPIKNVPVKVQKVMLDFKNIIGSWGVSDANKDRYDIIMKYLRDLVPYFKTVDFDERFSNILDTIESEIARNKVKFDLLKSISAESAPRSSSSNDNKKNGEHKESGIDVYDEEDVAEKNVLQTIDLNISLNTDENDEDDDNDDEDNVSSTSPIDFPELKPPVDLKNRCPKPRGKKTYVKGKKCRLEEVKRQWEVVNLSESSTDSTYSPISNPSKTNLQNKARANKSKAPKSSRFPPLPDGTPDRSRFEVIWEGEPDSPFYPAYLDKMKKLKEKEEKYQAAASSTQVKLISSNTAPQKSSTNSEPLAKKPRLEAPLIVDEGKKENKKTENINTETKPKINAFAFLMNRSKEIAQQKKQMALAKKLAMVK